MQDYENMSSDLSLHLKMLHLKMGMMAKFWLNIPWILIGFEKEACISIYTAEIMGSVGRDYSHIQKRVKLQCFYEKWHSERDAEQKLLKDRERCKRIKLRHEIFVLNIETCKYQEASPVGLIWSSEKSVSYSIFKNIFITFKFIQ